MIDDLTVWSSPLTPAEVTLLATGATIPLALQGTPVPVGPTVESGSLIHTGFLANGLAPDGNRIESQSTARRREDFRRHLAPRTERLLLPQLHRGGVRTPTPRSNRP